MASSHSDAAKLEQIITEFFAKSLHIILESRSTSCVSSRNFSGEQCVSSPASSSSSSSSSVRSRDKWFNLALRECPAALENIDICRQSNLGLMIIDVTLVKRKVDWDPLGFSPQKELFRNMSSKERSSLCSNSDQEELGYEVKSEKIIERWVVQYESKKNRNCSSTSTSRRSSNNLHVLYKKATLLLRSLYLTMRLLPAYKIFRDLNSSGRLHEFALGHRVSSFVEPFTSREEAEMQRFGFNPVDTSYGRLSVSVVYRPSALDVSSEPSTPMSPQFIQDYVGSPLAEPLKRFPSFPATKGVQVSPSSSPFSRRHSWSYEQYKTSSPSISFSPSPTHSDIPASVSNPGSRRFSPMSLPPHPSETSLASKKETGFGCPSSGVSPSPSPSPSPPVHLHAYQVPKGLLRSESAPVSIAGPIPLNSGALLEKQNAPVASPCSSTRSGASTTGDSLLPTLSKATSVKFLSHGKENSGRYSTLRLLPDSLPWTSFARSRSESLPDDYDETEFTCPFDVDEDDMASPGSRRESFDHKGHSCPPSELGVSFPIKRSQDAAVGALVQMLKKASPLRQDLTNSVNPSSTLDPARQGGAQEPFQIQDREGVQHTASSTVTSSHLVASKTASDALEELKGYREMKNLLLSQGGRSQLLANHTSMLKPSGTSTAEF